MGGGDMYVLVIRYRPAGRGRSRGQGQAAAGGGSAGVLRVTLVTTTSTRGWDSVLRRLLGQSGPPM